VNENMAPDIIRFMKRYVENSFVINREITVNFNGGEPLLEFPLLKTIVEESKKNGINKFSISTNFTLAADEILDFLIAHNFSIQLSIDGRKATHDAFRRDYEGTGSFDKVFSNITLLKKKYPDYTSVIYSMVFTPVSVSNLYDNIKYLIDNGLYNIISSFNAYDTWDARSIDIYRQQIEKIGSLYRRMYDQGQPVFIKLLTPQIEWLLSGIGKADCGACQDIIGIIQNGDVLACGAFLNSRSYDKYKIGSIYTEFDFKNIERFFSRDAIDISMCSDCVLLPRCHNKCFALNLQTSGDIHTIPASMCAINRFSILEADKILEYLVSSNNPVFYNQYKAFLGGNE
jgi:uncharacterized protein